MVLKKPSHSHCSVCPSKVGNDGGRDEIVRRDPKSEREKRIAWRNAMKKTRKTPVRRKHTFSHKGGRRTRVVDKEIVNKVEMPHRRSLATRSRNHYFGVDVYTEVVRALEGDVFTNIMTGATYFRKHGIWNLIPGYGPRCYLGTETEFNSLSYVSEGDLFLEQDSGRMMVRQDQEWQEFRIFESTGYEEKLMGRLKSLIDDKELILNNMMMNKNGSLSLDRSLDRSLDDGSLDRSLDDGSLDKSLDKGKPNKTLEVKKGLQSERFSLEMKPIHAQFVGEYRQISAACLQKLHPRAHQDLGGTKADIDVAPEGDVEMCVDFGENGWLGDIEIDLQSWIKYTDHQKKIWQTVVCLSDLELFDLSGNLITDFVVEAKNGDGSQLIDLKQKLKTVTTLSDHEQIIIKSGITIGKMKWGGKLVAYLPELVGKKDFFSIEFKEMHQPIKLPQMKVHFVAVSA